MKRGMLHFAYDRKYPVQVMSVTSPLSLRFWLITVARSVTALFKASVGCNRNIHVLAQATCQLFAQYLGSCPTLLVLSDCASIAFCLATVCTLQFLGRSI